MSTVGDFAHAAEVAVSTSDQLVRNKYYSIPLFKEALDLQDDLFAIADEVGVGAEVRAFVYADRGLAYLGLLAQNFFPGAAAAGASVLASVGGFAALGAAGVVAAVVASVFGGDDQDELAEHRRRKAARALKRLLSRLTLTEIGQEQYDAVVMAQPWLPSRERTQALADAERMRRFYRAADTRLSKPKRELFTALSNAGRWASAAGELSERSGSDQYEMSKLVGVPDLVKALAWRVAEEKKRLLQLTPLRLHLDYKPKGAGLAGLFALAAYAASRILRR